MSAILKIILFAVLSYYGAKAQISATDWDSISPNLVQYFSAQLPTPPSNAINIANPGALGEPNPFFTMTVDFTHSAPLDTCGQSQPISNWPSKAAELGSKDHGGFCRIQFYSSEYEFRCKNSTANSAPVSADPAWVQMRFPVLPKQDYGEPRSIFFKFDPRNSYYGFNAFGGNPCAAANVTPSYECRLNIVGPWDRRVPSGYYVLFTTPGAQGYIVTGPHRFYPQGRVDIPDQLRTADIEELDVVFMTFNQYPVTAECPLSGACNVGQYRLLLLNSVTLETGIDLTFSRDPPTAHPRLFGTDSDFLTNKVDPFLNLPCDNSVTGQLVNVRRAFENGFLGGNSCQKTIPTSLYNHTLAKKYFDMELPSFNQGTRSDEGRKIMFLIRYLRACHKLNRQNCLFPSSEVEALVPKVIQREFSYWASWNWDNNYGGYAGTEYIQFGYDLGTTPTFIFWSTFVDTFWNDINTTTRTTIETQFDVIIFNFRRLIDLQLWPMWNGNNWTPFLSTPIGYWGIAYWHEHDQATETVQMMLRAMYLHRRMFLDDGVYQEGMSYVGMSMDSMMELDFVLFAGTGTHIDSMRWDRIAILHRWMNDGMLGDGSSMDFGDANVLVGFSSLLSLYSMYIDEVMDRGTSVVDPCQLKQFWTNKYFEAGFDDPWGLHKSMARNWTNLVIQCTSQAPLLQPQVTVYPLGGNGFIKTRVAFNASIGLGPADRRSLADWNTMALEAKPSAFPHTELDFGALIWTAYGSRVLTDLGYGKIASVKTNDFDSNPAGCNCLVVEEAFPNATTIVNYSQFDGVSGSVTAIAFQGSDQNYTSVLLDGSKPYGSEREDGWLSRYYRYAVPLGGSIVLIDSIAKHARLSGVHVTEYFYSGDDNTTCSMRAIDSTQTLISNTELEVKPRCRNTQNNALAATVTRISAASLSESVQFTVDGAVSYEIVFGKFDTRKRSRARGAKITDPEVRVFLLLAAPSQSQLPTHGVTKVDCSGDQICFEVAIADDKWRFEFKRDAVGHYLNCVRGADSSGSYSDATCTVYEIDSPVLTPPTNGPTSAAPAANNSPQQFSPGTQNISAATSTDLSAVVLLAALLGVF